MTTATLNVQGIVARTPIGFGLDQGVPKYWFQSSPYKTRLFDGMHLTFPEGERFFITSVRAFRDRIEDAELLEQVKTFTRQEGEHSAAHRKYHRCLQQQGLPVDHMLAAHSADMEGYRQRYSAEFNLALTAAFEHFTALLADTFFSHAETTEGMDERVRALMAWHAIEELEHKSVAFDVMTRVARVGYWKRTAAMVLAMKQIAYMMFGYTDQMLKADGYGWFQRKWLAARHLRWMFGRNGVLALRPSHLLAYFKPGFHPNDLPTLPAYWAWQGEYERSGDPLKALHALLAAA